MTVARTPEESLASSAVVGCVVLRTTPDECGKAPASRLASCVAKMVPTMAVPIELPMFRSSVVPDVATPRSS